VISATRRRRGRYALDSSALGQPLVENIEYEIVVSVKCKVYSTYLNLWFTAEHFAPDMYVQYDNVGGMDIKLVCDTS
jgi:hypothetical protein